jgi:Ni,Fe-hydrogenase III small subunit
VAEFIPLKSLKPGPPPDPQAILADIRRIYFKTTRRTIEHDIAHAIELLKSLPSEEEREKATVYMEGLAQMRREWARKNTT